MDIYFGFKLITEYIIPAIIVALLVIAGAVVLLASNIKERRVKNFFVSHGYERELFDVPSVGTGAFYGWVRKSDNKKADDRHIKGMSLKEIKEEYQ